MKAERRHELKNNSLAQGIENFPAFMQVYGSRVLLGVIVLLLIIILGYRYTAGRDDRAKLAGSDLTAALYALDQLRSPPLQSQEAVASTRKAYAREAEDYLSHLLSTTDDPKLKAQALVTRGDLNWMLATYPPLPAAATRPELYNFSRSKDELLKSADDAYQQVLEAPLNQDHPSVIGAHFGSAAVAEERGQWDKARQAYQQIIDDGAAAQAFKDLARRRLDGVARLSKPAYIGGPITPDVPATVPTLNAPPTTDASQPATAPASAPVGSGPVSTAPATQPTTLPAATQPATVPAAAEAR